jgi:hypothetical protein
MSDTTTEGGHRRPVQVGEVFGELTAREVAGRDKRGHILWRCDCSCGEPKLVRASRLCSGDTRSCGARSKHWLGCKSPKWKGGRTRNAAGYVLVHVPDHPFADSNGYYFEHRLVMEQYLGRYLTKDETVHHINHIKTDNRLANLKLCRVQREHSQEHALPPGQLDGVDLLSLPPGRHHDGGGLYLYLQGTRHSWVFRYQSPSMHRDRTIGLGPLSIVGLQLARIKAADFQRQITKFGNDPAEHCLHRRWALQWKFVANYREWKDYLRKDAARFEWTKPKIREGNPADYPEWFAAKRKESEAV